MLFLTSTLTAVIFEYLENSYIYYYIYYYNNKNNNKKRNHAPWLAWLAWLAWLTAWLAWLAGSHISKTRGISSVLSSCNIAQGGTKENMISA